jgi:predicted pyridoxine 5'-phosphate oxidase superfamily flavin-nucleotide-binding protein
MAKIAKEMQEMIARARVCVIATASIDGKPNVVPLGLTRVISDNEILVMDNYMNKTRANLEANPVAAISVWDLELHMGYQFKGKVRIETTGEVFEKGKQLVKTRRPQAIPRAAIILTVNEIFLVGSDDNAGKRIS